MRSIRTKAIEATEASKSVEAIELVVDGGVRAEEAIDTSMRLGRSSGRGRRCERRGKDQAIDYQHGDAKWGNRCGRSDRTDANDVAYVAVDASDVIEASITMETTEAIGSPCDRHELHDVAYAASMATD